MNEGRFRKWEIPFSVVLLDFSSTCGEQLLKACSHDPGTAHSSGKLTDPGVNFASVHGLTFVTVHMNFSLPRASSRGGLPFYKVTGLAKVTFLHVNTAQKLPREKSSLAHAHY